MDEFTAHRIEFPSYETLFGKKNLFENDFSSEPDDSTVKKLMMEQSERRMQANNSKVAKILFEEIDTNDDQLKYEYIQMVKSGKEEEHMTYLLQGDNFIFF